MLSKPWAAGSPMPSFVIGATWIELHLITSRNASTTGSRNYVEPPTGVSRLPMFMRRLGGSLWGFIRPHSIGLRPEATFPFLGIWSFKPHTHYRSLHILLSKTCLSRRSCIKMEVSRFSRTSIHLLVLRSDFMSRHFL